MPKINSIFYIVAAMFMIAITGLLIFIALQLGDRTSVQQSAKQYSESISTCTAQAKEQATKKNEEDAAARTASARPDFQKYLLADSEGKFLEKDYDFYYLLCMREHGYDK